MDVNMQRVITTYQELLDFWKPKLEGQPSGFYAHMLFVTHEDRGDFYEVCDLIVDEGGLVYGWNDADHLGTYDYAPDGPAWHDTLSGVLESMRFALSDDFPIVDRAAIEDDMEKNHDIKLCGGGVVSVSRPPK